MKVEAAFASGGSGPPVFLRVNEDRTYVVEWVRRIRAVAEGDNAPPGWLVATIEAYSSEVDETLTLDFVVAAMPDDPQRPNWSSMRPKDSATSVTPLRRQFGDTASFAPAAGMSARAGLDNPGAPDWRRATCLGCGAPVVRNRHAHYIIGGTLSGGWLVVWPTKPDHADATGPTPSEPIFLLGACHRRCSETAVALLRSNQAQIERPLVPLRFEQGEQAEYNLHRPADARTCLFCNATESLTDEHIWPKWVSRELQSMGKTLANRPGEKRARASIDVTVPVCRSCNNGWLSTLENDTANVLRRMLWGEFLALNRRAQDLLATWATKTAFLIDRISDPVVSRGFPMELAIERRPPPGIRVFLAAYRGERAAYASKTALSLGTEHAAEPNGFVATFSACKVAFQVLGCFVQDFEFRDGRGREALVQLWPSEGDAVWPPELVTTDAGLDSLAASISAS